MKEFFFLIIAPPFALIFAIWGGMDCLAQFGLDWDGVEATATVLEIRTRPGRRGGINRTVTLQFDDAAGRRRRATVPHYDAPPFRVTDRVLVTYLPENPRRLRIEQVVSGGNAGATVRTFRVLAMDYGLPQFVVVGVLAVFVGILCFLSRGTKRGPKR